MADTDLATPDTTSFGAMADSTMRDLASVQRDKIKAESGATGEMMHRQEADRALVERAFKAEGAGPDQLRPWNAEAEHKKFETDPVAGIGSLGGVFAVIASAFTHAPMLSALEGMSGAINGIKEGNEAAYNRAYDSWQQNMKLAEERHKMQHEAYTDALALSEHDMRLSDAKLRALAARFDDKKMLAMIEHGMVPEIYQTLAARNQAMDQMSELSKKQTLDTWLQREAKSEFDAIDQSDLPPAQKMARKAASIMRIYGKGSAEPPQYQIAGQYFMQNPTATAEEAAEALAKKGVLFRPTTSGPGGKLTAAGENTRMVLERKNELMKQDPSLSETEAYTQAAREIKTESTPPSANQVDKLRGLIDQGDNVVSKIEKVQAALDSHAWSAGLGGKIMRGEEIAENITGISTKSDRAQMRRDVLEIQEMVPQILSNQQGRPLKAVQEKIDGIVAGLNAGDTGPNTKRAMRELLVDIKKRIADYRGRLEGGYDPDKPSSGTDTTAGATAPTDTGWYKQAPAVQ
jgi:hypothetical protein